AGQQSINRQPIPLHPITAAARLERGKGTPATMQCAVQAGSLQHGCRSEWARKTAGGRPVRMVLATAVRGRKPKVIEEPQVITGTVTADVAAEASDGSTEIVKSTKGRRGRKAAEGTVEDQAPPVEAAGRKGRRTTRSKPAGNTAVVGDALMQEMITNTTQTALDGTLVIDRAALGKGELHWYCIGVLTGKEKKFEEELVRRLKNEPPMIDPVTGDVMPRGEVEVKLPTRKEYSLSETTKRKVYKTIKYQDGGVMFIRCVLNNDLIFLIARTPFFQSWRNQVSWKYPGDVEFTELPLPCTPDQLDALAAWEQEQVVQEADDLAAKSERVDKVAENMDVDESGNTIYKREFTGTYNNPSAWVEGTLQTAPSTPSSAEAPPPPPAAASAKKTRRRTSAAPTALSPDSDAASTAPALSPSVDQASMPAPAPASQPAAAGDQAAAPATPKRRPGRPSKPPSPSQTPLHTAAPDYVPQPLSRALDPAPAPVPASTPTFDPLSAAVPQPPAESAPSFSVADSAAKFFGSSAASIPAADVPGGAQSVAGQAATFDSTPAGQRFNTPAQDGPGAYSGDWVEGDDFDGADINQELGSLMGLPDMAPYGAPPLSGQAVGGPASYPGAKLEPYDQGMDEDGPDFLEDFLDLDPDDPSYGLEAAGREQEGVARVRPKARPAMRSLRSQRPTGLRRSKGTRSQPYASPEPLPEDWEHEGGYVDPAPGSNTFAAPDATPYLSSYDANGGPEAGGYIQMAARFGGDDAGDLDPFEGLEDDDLMMEMADPFSPDMGGD
ncbi:hypothetical protein QJQ45_013815, partial [Haematococcus lacustris]